MRLGACIWVGCVWWCGWFWGKGAEATGSGPWPLCVSLSLCHWCHACEFWQDWRLGAYRFLCVCLFRLHLQHMEVPRLGIQMELQLLAYAVAAVTPDLSRTCDLHHTSWQHWILNPLSRARDRTCILMGTSQVHYRWATRGTPGAHNFKSAWIPVWFPCWIHKQACSQLWSCVLNVMKLTFAFCSHDTSLSSLFSPSVFLSFSFFFFFPLIEVRFPLKCSFWIVSFYWKDCSELPFCSRASLEVQSQSTDNELHVWILVGGAFCTYGVTAVGPSAGFRGQCTESWLLSPCLWGLVGRTLRVHYCSVVKWVLRAMGAQEGVCCSCRPPWPPANTH